MARGGKALKHVSAPKSVLKSVLKSPKPKVDQPVKHHKPEVETQLHENEEDGELEEDEDEHTDEHEDVNEEGIAKLMAALGEDGLDEFAQAELRALAGEDEQDREKVGNADEVEDVVEGAETDEDQEEGKEIADEELEQGEGAEHDDDEEREEQEEEDVPLDEVESVEEDTVPRQKLAIDNKNALERIRETFKLEPSIAWTETLAITYPETVNVDVDDDLNRELSFYKQALHGATTARSLAAKHTLPFTRPSDYFAEMVKSDAHMERIRQRLLDESATIKRSEDKRKEREGKKFGKQVQMEKLKEREKSKKDMDERLKGLKRKRKGALDGPDGEDFDVAVEDAISDRPSKRARGGAAGGKRGLPRNARDKKFGFGGAGKRSKQNTKDSTDDFGGGGGRGRGGARGGRSDGRGGRGGAKPNRPGKSRRMQARS